VLELAAAPRLRCDRSGARVVDGRGDVVVARVVAVVRVRETREDEGVIRDEEVEGEEATTEFCWRSWPALVCRACIVRIKLN
jgi:hypothetical protein